MKYFFYEVVLLLLLVVLVYFPGGLLLQDEPHLFEKVFSTGDLLGIGALVLMNSYVELDKTEWELGEEMFNRSKAFSFLSGIFVLATYLFARVSALHFQFDTEPIARRITVCAWVSIGCLFYSAILGWYTRFLTARVRKSTRRGSARGAHSAKTFSHPSN
ncbi:hypothetical protein [Caballeronia sp. BR00000012568055]|uniref:hypothetical protein n=1 Tax=Caballeronia sp. BR00000012568055 TaxID=2918761 RepID=UPI0023F9E053|nr:hypothetical protein [Caballeronia sp. BR00000012568055]